jgi:hypothetical protein
MVNATLLPFVVLVENLAKRTGGQGDIEAVDGHDGGTKGGAGG